MSLKCLSFYDYVGDGILTIRMTLVLTEYLAWLVILLNNNNLNVGNYSFSFIYVHNVFILIFRFCKKKIIKDVSKGIMVPCSLYELYYYQKFCNVFYRNTLEYEKIRYIYFFMYREYYCIKHYCRI